MAATIKSLVRGRHDPDGDMDCVRCANPQHTDLFDALNIDHAFSGNCEHREPDFGESIAEYEIRHGHSWRNGRLRSACLECDRDHDRTVFS